MYPRTKTINSIIIEKEYTDYLEIGIADGSNIRAIKCHTKVGVDPIAPSLSHGGLRLVTATSDDFFSTNKDKFDLVFIDGLHYAEQVERDIVNAYASLKAGGMILIHDCNPFTEEMATVPRIQDQWTGDVYKAVVGFIQKYKGKVNMGYFDDPYGLFAIYKTGRVAVKSGFNLPDLSYNDFIKLNIYNELS